MINLLISWLFLVYIQISFLSSSKNIKKKSEYNCMVLFKMDSLWIPLFPCEMPADVFLLSLVQWYLWELSGACEQLGPRSAGVFLAERLECWYKNGGCWQYCRNLPCAVFLRQGPHPAWGWEGMRAAEAARFTSKSRLEGSDFSFTDSRRAADAAVTAVCT